LRAKRADYGDDDLDDDYDDDDQAGEGHDPVRGSNSSPCQPGNEPAGLRGGEFRGQFFF
jgi:hypothetical protein